MYEDLGHLPDAIELEEYGNISVITYLIRVADTWSEELEKCRHNPTDGGAMVIYKPLSDGGSPPREKTTTTIFLSVYHIICHGKENDRRRDEPRDTNRHRRLSKQLINDPDKSLREQPGETIEARWSNLMAEFDCQARAKKGSISYHGESMTQMIGRTLVSRLCDQSSQT